MGDIRNISTWTLTAALALGLLLASSATGDEAAPVPVLDPIEANGDPQAMPHASPVGQAGSDSLPLTRAASRGRIADMSPVDWLARYGDVVVGRAAGTPAPR